MSSTGVLKYGDAAAQEVSERFGGAFDTEALLQALGPDKRIDGMVVVAGGRIFQFDVDSTASDGLSPSSGSGKWLVRGEASALVRVRVATAAALPANTRTSNTLTADANGALNDTGIDGITNLAVGNLVLVKNESTGANNGVYVLTGIGAAGAKWTMERAATHMQSDQMRAGVLVVVAEGTANKNILFELTTDDAITLNTTSLTFSAIATTAGASLKADLASTANGYGASLVSIEDSGGIITATTVEGGLAENRTAIDAAEASIAAAETNITDLEAKTFVRSITITSADLTASATTQAIDIGAALPVGAYVQAASYNLTDAFDAGGGSASACTCQVGWAGSTNAVMAATDVFTGAATEGAGLTTAATTPTAADEKTLQALFTATGDNVDTLTNGSITINVLCLAPVADA